MHDFKTACSFLAIFKLGNPHKVGDTCRIDVRFRRAVPVPSPRRVLYVHLFAEHGTENGRLLSSRSVFRPRRTYVRPSWLKTGSRTVSTDRTVPSNQYCGTAAQYVECQYGARAEPRCLVTTTLPIRGKRDGGRNGTRHGPPSLAYCPVCIHTAVHATKERPSRYCFRKESAVVAKEGVAFMTSQELGRGVEGEVWKGHFKGSKVDFAIKQVQARSIADSPLRWFL